MSSSNTNKQVSSALSRLSSGDRIFSQYEIVKLLGVGSAGLVYLCKHLHLADYPLAIKVFFNNRQDVDLERFKREILSAYNVNHPNVIRCYEYLSSEDLIAFTMEYVDGGTLYEKMQEEEFKSYTKILSTLLSICSGLAAVHEAGIIHRDLKPENVLFSSSGQVKITDFSIAHHEVGPKLGTGGVLGTIDYISPEYLGGKKLDSRIDIYALGVIAYEMVTGQIPCKGKNPYHTLKIRMEQKAELPSILRENCPVILEKIIMKALEPNPDDRYQSVEQMHQDLLLFAEVLTNKKSLDSIQSKADDFEERPFVYAFNKNSFFEKLEVMSFGALFSLAGVGASYLMSLYLL